MDADDRHNNYGSPTTAHPIGPPATRYRLVALPVYPAATIHVAAGRPPAADGWADA